jgi:hypothetical protein
MHGRGKRHVDLANHRIVFPVSEEKMERIPRIIYLTDNAESIIRRLMAKSPSGPIFLNGDGQPWTPDAVTGVSKALERIVRRFPLLSRPNLRSLLMNQELSKRHCGISPRNRGYQASQDVIEPIRGSEHSGQEVNVSTFPLHHLGTIRPR